MSAFDDCRKSQNYLDFESAMMPVIQRLSGGIPTPLEAENRAKCFELQSFGDYIAYNAKRNEQYRFELKVETRMTGNLFIESWSNRQMMRLGWFLTVKPDVLIYGFAEPTRVAFVIPWQKLKSFLWYPEYRVDNYRHVPQGKHEQHNDTFGWLVPIADLESAKVIFEKLKW